MNFPQTEDIRNRLLVARLPSLPQTLLKLLALCQSDDAGLADVAKLIASEPGLTARVLAVAHSAAYRRSDKQLDLLQAASTLGMDLIKVLVISESVFQTFHGFTHAGSIDLRSFWKHSLAVAVIAKALAQHQNDVQPEEAYLAGLLHDVGRLALLAAAPQLCQPVFMLAEDDQLCELEQARLKISHTEAGAWLAGQWRLSNQMVEAVLYHHAEQARLPSTEPLTRLVHLAHRLAALEETLPDDFEYTHELSRDALGEIVTSAAERVVQTARDLGIDISVSASTPVAAGTDPVQTQLTEEMRNRALLADLPHTLAEQSSTRAALAVMRHQAGILLQLDDAMVLLFDDDGQTLSLAAGDDRHPLASSLSPMLSAHPLMTACAHSGKVTFSSRSDGQDGALLDAMQADHLACIPLGAGRSAVGMLVAAVPAALLDHLRHQTTLLQAFGNHAGAALARRRQADLDHQAHMANVRKEQQLSVKKLAHEVNNPISVIKNYLHVIDDKLHRQEPVRTELSRLGQEISRVGHIVEEFSDLGQATTLSPVDLSQVVPELVQLLLESRFFPASINIQCDLPAQNLWVQGSTDMIKQVLLNLIKNARECLPEGGQIAIHGGTPVNHAGSSYTRLLVSDNGPGLSADLQARLFEPVHSSKTGDYRGLGLSIVHDLVKKMGGHVRVHSSTDGTRFEILLPGAAPAQTAR
ncbi:HDOD domain-containing protein [Rhodoferax sp.]|uniref:HDOD domain-containing protein n=1 Tax=Rhodoferax sp. TaxID=50421 RepID=UPI0026020AEC|nr:HDOD domain-containing protein [Rhodoferax sp.]MDD2924516.1 HDOD domain-containing protein [Rhodoferax sp.]